MTFFYQVLLQFRLHQRPIKGRPVPVKPRGGLVDLDVVVGHLEGVHQLGRRHGASVHLQQTKKRVSLKFYESDIQRDFDQM
jgi:hypothetical protein